MLIAKRVGRISGTLALGFAVMGLMAATGADSQERKAYKYVDEKGKVVYSQTPPPGKASKQVDIAPAYRGSGGSTTNSPYDDPNRYSGSHDDQYARNVREQQRRAEEAQQKRVAELEAECNRNRGVDCKNPETLRLIESNRIPGGRRY